LTDLTLGQIEPPVPPTPSESPKRYWSRRRARPKWRACGRIVGRTMRPAPQF